MKRSSTWIALGGIFATCLFVSGCELDRSDTTGFGARDADTRAEETVTGEPTGRARMEVEDESLDDDAPYGDQRIGDPADRLEQPRTAPGTQP